MSTDATIIFKEWLPDQPELNNPGLLEALNVLPIDEAYEPYRPLVAYSNTIGSFSTTSSFVSGAFVSVWAGQSRAYAALINADTAGATKIFASNASLQTFADRTPSGGTTALLWQFAQYDDLVIAVSEATVAFAHTIGATSAFTPLATSGDTTGAQHVGVINKFVFLGNGDLVSAGGVGPNGVRWSGFDAPRSWPTPSSATAIAQQSGQESMDGSLGLVTGIASGDQYGIVFQQFGLTRVTYIGPPAVFQFDQYERGRGCFYPDSIVQMGNLVYYLSDKGFCVTDGVQVINIGAGKVDETFFADLAIEIATGSIKRISGGCDVKRGLIYWCYPSSSAGLGFRPDRIFIFNTLTKRWTHAEQDVWRIFGGFVRAADTQTMGVIAPFGIDTTNRLATFTSTAGEAILETAETEINPGGFARVSGVKPLVGATANAITVALGTRNNRTDAVSYTAEATANGRSGFCGFRSEARYHRARVTITGTFNAAQGIEVDAAWSGQT